MTTVSRTLLDLAPRLSSDELARACHEAWVHHRMRPQHVEACIAPNPGEPGAAKLRRALGTEKDVARRRRSNHVAYTYGDVFERPAQTIADLTPRLRSA